MGRENVSHGAWDGGKPKISRSVQCSDGAGRRTVRSNLDGQTDELSDSALWWDSKTFLVKLRVGQPAGGSKGRHLGQMLSPTGPLPGQRPKSFFENKTKISQLL